MFEQNTPRTTVQSAIRQSELIYHSVVRHVRRTHGNAVLSILLTITQAMAFVLAFYVIFVLLGLRRSAVRGDFLLYIMSGIFLFMTHTRTLGAVVRSEGPASPIMQHAPMNTVVAIAAAALGTLYIQVLAMAVILFLYHAIFVQITIEEPIGAFFCLLVAWFTGAALGVVLLAIKPWSPRFVSIFTTVYQRANVVASGKMFLANSLPAAMLAMFDWNPLFHCIDQARGHIFLNYTPRYTSIEYAIWVGVALLMVGMMGEFYTRRHASVSWSARR